MTWKKAYLETRVLSADPVELINILYEHATLSVQDARDSLAQGDIRARSQAITKAISILGELESSLDLKLGGEIASNLSRLYRYMREKLTLGNLKQTDGPLAEVEELLQTLGEAWRGIGHDQSGRARDEAPARKAAAEWNAVPMIESMADQSSHSWSA